MTGRTGPVTIRGARIDDAAAIARVHVDSWRTTYRGIIPDEILDGLSYQERAERRREHLSIAPAEVFHLVAELGGEIVGFAAAGPEREGSSEYAGELYAIYLLQSAQGRGIGRMLMRAVAEALLQRGLESLFVWVLAENPARHFYEALGGAVVREKPITIGVPLRELGYGWKDIRPLCDSNVSGRSV